MKKTISYFLAVVITVSVAIPPARVSAADHEFYAGNDILLYDRDACGPAQEGGNNIKGLVGNDNYEKGLRYFVGKGLTLAQAAGILGNFSRESSMNPAIIQGGKIADANYKLVDGVGFGIAQWTSGGRQQGLEKLASTSNRPIIDLSLQLDYTWQELTTGYKTALANLKKSTDPAKAAYIFHRDFEKSADTEAQVNQNRGGDAKALYAKYRSVINDGSGSTSGDADLCATAKSDIPSAYVDGFAIYNQSDPKKDWSKLPYGPQRTVAEAGCGPSAMAMIITALTKKIVTPKDTATYGAANGTVYTVNGVGAGSLHNIDTVVGNHWGLRSTALGKNIAQINAGLRKGGLVIMAGSGAAPFTRGGHFIVVRGVTASNKWLVADSNGTQGIENSKKEWDPNYILSMNGSGFVRLLTYGAGA